MYQGLAKILQDSLEYYYKWWVEQFPNEEMYSFCLFSEALVSYSGVTVFTKEGLQQVAKKYKLDEFYNDETLSDLEKDLKWSACDSPHHFENGSIFESVNSRLAEISKYTHSLSADDPKFNEHIEVMYSLFVVALNGFRESSLNGKQEIILSVWFGDQSEEEIEYFIRNCNGPKLVEKFYNEWD